MDLPDVSRKYNAVIEEIILGRGDYIVGGARSPAFLDLDNCRRRRPLVFGEAYDTLEGYHSSAADMFSGRQSDIEEWAVMWKELGADGVCLRLTGDGSAELVKRIVSRVNIPIMVSSDTETLRSIASAVSDHTLILYSKDEEQSLELSGVPNGHAVVAKCSGSEPQDLCRRMKDRGAEKIIVDLGPGRMDCSLKDLRERIDDFRMKGLNGDDDSRHPIMCDISPSWEMHSDDVSPRRASMVEASVGLTVMMSGADLLVVKGPGAADMTRVYGEELADL